jgi:phage terminase Nu1 subunit (DNA packaging protein)
LRPITIAELAIQTSLHVRTVARLLGDAGLTPIGKNGRAIHYDSEKALKAIFRSGDSSKERLEAAKAELAEIELAERRGELLSRSNVIELWQRGISAFRARMLAIPSKIAGQFAPPGKLQQAEEALTQAIHEALAEVAGDGTGGGGA